MKPENNLQEWVQIQNKLCLTKTCDFKGTKESSWYFQFFHSCKAFIHVLLESFF